MALDFWMVGLVLLLTVVSYLMCRTAIGIDSSPIPIASTAATPGGSGTTRQGGPI